MNYLSRILEEKKQEIGPLIARRSKKLFSSALKRKELAVIAEIKRRSPSQGEMAKIDDPLMLSQEYCKAGVAAISILTDKKNFGGSLEDLRLVAEAQLSIPLLRKDFIFHPIQLAEAAFFGADAVLLIVAAVGKNLKFLLQEAHHLGLEVLTEVHDEPELELALKAGAEIIGVNHRNLTTFEVDLSVSKRLRPHIPSSIITVAESGIQTLNQAREMREMGFDAVLVGEALVKSRAPALLIEQMRGLI